MLSTTSPSAPTSNPVVWPHSILFPPRAGVSLESWWTSATQATAPTPGVLHVSFAGGSSRKELQSCGLQRWSAPPDLCPSAPGEGLYPEAPGHD